MGREKVGLTGVASEALKLLGQEIRIERTRKGWTQRELGVRAGMSERTVSLIERGDPAVSVGNVLNAAAITGVPLFSLESDEAIGQVRRSRSEVAALIPQRVDTKDLSHVNRDF